MNRRDFIASLAAAGALAKLPVAERTPERISEGFVRSDHVGDDFEIDYVNGLACLMLSWQLTFPDMPGFRRKAAVEFRPLELIPEKWARARKMTVRLTGEGRQFVIHPTKIDSNQEVLNMPHGDFAGPLTIRVEGWLE